MDLLLAAPGQTVFWQPQKRIAICSPPKVGTSFSHSWLVWSEVSAETACKYGVQQLSSEAKQFCADAGIAKTGDLYAPHNFESLVMHRGHLRLLLPADHRDWRLFVLARDPWSRLMSGFSNKILGISGINANKTNHIALKEIHNFIPSLDERAASHDATPALDATRGPISTRRSAVYKRLPRQPVVRVGRRLRRRRARASGEREVLNSHNGMLEWTLMSAVTRPRVIQQAFNASIGVRDSSDRVMKGRRVGRGASSARIIRQAGQPLAASHLTRRRRR